MIFLEVISFNRKVNLLNINELEINAVETSDKDIEKNTSNKKIIIRILNLVLWNITVS